LSLARGRMDLGTCSTQPSPVQRVGTQGISIETNISSRCTTNQFICRQQEKWALWVDHQLNAEWLDTRTRFRTSIPDTGTYPNGIALPRTAWVQLNHLLTGVGRFRSWLYKCGLTSSVACECGAEE